MSLSNILNIQEQRPTPTPVPGGGGRRTPATTTPAQPQTGGSAIYNEIEKDYPTITIYSRLFIFLTKDGPFTLNSKEKEFGDILVKTNDKKIIGYK